MSIYTYNSIHGPVELGDARRAARLIGRYIGRGEHLAEACIQAKNTFNQMAVDYLWDKLEHNMYSSAWSAEAANREFIRAIERP